MCGSESFFWSHCWYCVPGAVGDPSDPEGSIEDLTDCVVCVHGTMITHIYTHKVHLCTCAHSHPGGGRGLTLPFLKCPHCEFLTVLANRKKGSVWSKGGKIIVGIGVSAVLGQEGSHSLSQGHWVWLWESQL